MVTGRWKLGLLLALITSLLWGLLPLALKLLLDQMGAMTITWYRFLAATLILGWIMKRRRRLPALRKLGSSSWVLLTVAVLGLVGNYLLYLLALIYVTPNTTQIVIQLAPIFLLLGGLIFFGEPFRPLQWFGLAVLVAGLLLFFHNRLEELFGGNPEFYGGILLIVIASVGWAAYALAQKQMLNVFSSNQILLLLYAAAALLLLPLSHPFELADLDSLHAWLLLFACGNTLLAYGSFAEALVHWEASRVSAVLSLTPLFTLLSTKLFSPWFPEFISPRETDPLSLTGAGLVVLGSMLTALSRRRTPRPAPPPE